MPDSSEDNGQNGNVAKCAKQTRQYKYTPYWDGKGQNDTEKPTADFKAYLDLLA